MAEARALAASHLWDRTCVSGQSNEVFARTGDVQTMQIEV